TGKTITVPMMSNKDTFSYARSDTNEIIQLPYGTKKMSMYIVLPASNSSLKALLSNLNVAQWNALLKTLTPQYGRIRLPKFTVTYETGLKPALTTLGMGQAFDSLKATFPGIIEHQRVFISEVKHKAIMKIDEYGTLAAAITSIEIANLPIAPMMGQFDMIVNRPFFCVIRDDVTGTLLFMGAIVKPS
ncbi:MAG TPA: serpin family protein, partial [Ktedonobacteraceae bacterium]|nr:serpin family protein [Ktedonobacteraceae bacterium]